ncbi:MAG: PadR family transcriptional regulator [Kiloniellales bacterium]|nr:PadR family transcriptional regulator [Kiloniellales bacterium]MDJ0983547.1 PadR family transcriptional regulator [Kiloniellales bacterium]
MTRLLILWLLAEGPLHGYRIQKILSDPGLAFWFRVEDASIYAMLRSLVKQGLARIQGEEREGQRPSRTVYRITPVGRKALRSELESGWRELEPSREVFVAALAASDELEAEEIRQLLAERRAVLRARRARLDRVARSAPSGLLARREAALLDAEIAWLAREIEGPGSNQGETLP